MSKKSTVNTIVGLVVGDYSDSASILGSDLLHFKVTGPDDGLNLTIIEQEDGALKALGEALIAASNERDGIVASRAGVREGQETEAIGYNHPANDYVQGYSQGE